MIDIKEKYKQFCERQSIPFSIEESISSYDDTTLFCSAGMQQFKSKFKDTNCKLETISNIQPCLRMNDLDEIGDGSHLLYFNMMGLFSFRDITIGHAINFWMKFIQQKLGLKVDYVTIHPDKKEWSWFYEQWKISDIRYTDECLWTDGDIGGYCTEFFINDVEIGNIVNPLGDCIDAGFGLERLEMFVNKKVYTKEETLKETLFKMINSGIKPSNTKQGYILRKLLREVYINNWIIDHPFFDSEVKRQQDIVSKYNRLKKRHSDKTKDWWMSTLGIDIDSFKD